MLTDSMWSVLLPLFQRPHKPRGRPKADTRLLLEGVLWVLRTGAPWRDLPDDFGPWQTVYHHFRIWDREGTIDRAFERLRDTGHVTNEVWSIDGTLVRAHRCAAGAGKKGGRGEPEEHALGRSRGGFGTKAHLVVDATGLPLHVHLTGGQVHEAKAFDELANDLDALMENVRPQFVAGDKAYGANKIRAWLNQRKVTPVIPTKSNEKRVETFAKDVYRRRNVVERCIGWLKECRRVATRYEKLASRFLCMFKLAGLVLWLRAGFSDKA